MSPCSRSLVGSARPGPTAGLDRTTRRADCDVDDGQEAGGAVERRPPNTFGELLLFAATGSIPPVGLHPLSRDVQRDHAFVDFAHGR